MKIMHRRWIALPAAAFAALLQGCVVGGYEGGYERGYHQPYGYDYGGYGYGGWGEAYGVRPGDEYRGNARRGYDHRRRGDERGQYGEEDEE